MLRQTLQSLLEVNQVLTIEDAAEANYVNGELAIFVSCGDGFDDESLIDGGAHGYRVVARFEDEVGES